MYVRLESREKPVFSIGKVAKMLQLSQGTVIRAADTEELQSYCIPGSRARRITYKACKMYVEEYGLDDCEVPAGEEVVVLGNVEALTAELRKLLWETLEPTVVHLTDEPFTAGLQIGKSAAKTLLVQRNAQQASVIGHIEKTIESINTNGERPKVTATVLPDARAVLSSLTQRLRSKLSQELRGSS